MTKPIFLRLFGYSAVLGLVTGGSILFAQEPSFYAPDLVEAGKPLKLKIYGGGDFEVIWGDGNKDLVSNGEASHIFEKPSSVKISVKRRDGESWVGIPVNYEARMRESNPAFVAVPQKESIPGPADFMPKAMAFEGAKGIVLPAVLPAPADSFSMECWIRFDDIKGNQDFFLSQGKAQGGCTVGLRNGELFFGLTGRGFFSTSIAGKIDKGQWHHLAVTYDRVPMFRRFNRVRFYLDGIPAGVGMIDAADSGAVICPSAVVGAGGFKGSIAALAVYDNLLFPLAIWDHANALVPEPSLEVTVSTRGPTPVEVEEPAITNTVDVPLDPNPKADNGPALRKAIEIAQPGTRLRLVSSADGKSGSPFYIRSLIQGGNRWAGIPIENKTDFELDGGGSTLVFADTAARYVYIKGCKKIAIRNLAFDLDPAYARVGMYAKLTDVNPKTQVVRAQLIKGRDGSPDPLIPQRASYWRWRPHDPQTLWLGKGPYFDAGHYAEKPVADPSRGAGAIRFKLKDKPDSKIWNELKDYAAGANFYMINNGDFSSNAVSLMESSHVTFEGVNYYATLGMVFLSSDIDHVRVAHCKIGLPPGMTAADRPLSSGADGYHFHLVQGDIIFENNEITLTDDDPISLKDSVWIDPEKVDDYNLDARGKGIDQGSPVELLNPDYSFTGYQAKVTAVNGTILTLDKQLPAEIKKGSILMNRSHHTQNWIIRNNYFHDYYGRVMLYTDYGLFTGNRVHRSLYHLGNSAAYFEKAGVSRNVVTHRNLFEATDADSANWGGDQSRPAFHELTFSANSFLGKSLRMDNAANSLVVRNGFYSDKAPDEKNPLLALKGCVSTLVGDNLEFYPAAADFQFVQKNNTDVIVNGNRAIATSPQVQNQTVSPADSQ